MMDHGKIAKAAALLLECCAQSERLFVALAAFVKGMQDDRNLTEEEISAVRALVTQASGSLASGSSPSGRWPWPIAPSSRCRVCGPWVWR